MIEQRILKRKALDAFDTNEGVAEQIAHFKLCYEYNRDSKFTLLDIGGGGGYFISALQREYPNMRATILDLDNLAIEKAASNGLNGIVGSVLNPPSQLTSQKFDVICFNLVLHHIIATKDSDTRKLQSLALFNARAISSVGGSIFIHEICYEGRFFSGSSSAIIFHILTNALLSKMTLFISKYVPSLKANTLGVGVRYRAYDAWVKLIKLSGYNIAQECKSGKEGHSFVRRV